MAAMTTTQPYSGWIPGMWDVLNSKSLSVNSEQNMKGEKSCLLRGEYHSWDSLSLPDGEKSEVLKDLAGKVQRAAGNGLANFTGYVSGLSSPPESASSHKHRVYAAIQRSARMPSHQSEVHTTEDGQEVTYRVDAMRLLAVNLETHVASTIFCSFDANGACTSVEVPLGYFDNMVDRLDITQGTRIGNPVKVSPASKLRIQLSKEDEKIHPACFTKEGWVTIYHGSTPLVVHPDCLFKEGDKLGQDEVLIQGCNPTIFFEDRSDRRIAEQIDAVIGNRTLWAVSGAALPVTGPDRQIAPDFSSDPAKPLNKAFEAICLGVAQGIFDQAMEHHQETGKFVMLATGSMTYGNNSWVVSADQEIAAAYQRLWTKFCDSCEEGKKKEMLQVAALHVSGEEGRASSGIDWEVRRGTGLEGVLAEGGKISNNLKELFLACAERMYVVAGGPTACLHLVRGLEMGAMQKVIGIGFPNPPSGKAAGTHFIATNFEKAVETTVGELKAEFARGDESVIPRRIRILGIRGLGDLRAVKRVVVHSGGVAAYFLSEELSPIDGIKFSEFKDSPHEPYAETVEKIAGFVREHMRQCGVFLNPI